MSRSSAQPYRRLTRSRDERMICGVAGGLAVYLGVDPTLVRIGFVIAAFCGFVGVIAYGVMCLVMPEAETEAL